MPSGIDVARSVMDARTPSEIAIALEPGVAKIRMATASLLSSSDRSAYVAAPSSTRATSRSLVTAPSSVVLTMMSPNSSSVCRRPCALTDSWNSTSLEDGEPPITPAAAWTFCSWTAFKMSLADSPRSATFCGSSQTRIE